MVEINSNKYQEVLSKDITNLVQATTKESLESQQARLVQHVNEYTKLVKDTLEFNELMESLAPTEF